MEIKQTVNNQTKILSAAETLFEKNGYNATSISQIMKKSNLSNSLFYYYFHDKENIFLHIADSMSLDMYKEILRGIGKSKNLEEEIFNFYLNTFKFISHNLKRFRVFREVEFIDDSIQQTFYARLFSLLGEELKKRYPERFEYYNDALNDVLIGAGYFVGLKFIVWDKRKDFDYLAKVVSDFVLNGIDPDKNFRPSLSWQVKEVRPKEAESSTKGERTQKRIAYVAKKLFGKKGYWKTQISDIAKKADVGTGTFYLYFDSKKELLKYLVTEINKQLRENAMVYSLGAKNRKEVEVRALKAFADFIAEEREAYRIVRESEFVDGEIGKWYYERIGQPYGEALAAAMKRGEIRKIEPSVLAYSLMGMGHFMGVHWIIWNKKNAIPDETVLKVSSIMMEGIK
ncbi:MAG: TetR family transcriptional regulator [Nitrospiraceae bacterium]|nr:TetR family transcriptional regulator [Nitrospiraceae bacterium]